MAILNINTEQWLTRTITLGTADTFYVVVPGNYKLIAAFSVIDQALTTADETVVLKDHAGSTAGTITITQSGSAAGDVDSVSPTTNNTFLPGERLQIDIGGENGTAAICDLTFQFRPV